MDIQRIEAYNPNKINWQSLTAREILKYKNLGVEVPNQYLQWAQNFVNSVDSFRNDEVTYEKSVSETNKSGTMEDDNENDSGQGITEAQAGQNLIPDNQNTTTGDSENTSTKIKRKDRSHSGDNLRTQVQENSRESRTLAKDTSITARLTKLLESETEDEIQNLENDMKTILAESEEIQKEFKNEAGKLSSDNSDKSTIERLKELEQEIASYSTGGQNRISEVQSGYNDINSELKNNESLLNSASDYGKETLDMASELAGQAKNEDDDIAKIDIGIASLAQNSGRMAINASAEGEDANASALEVNNTKLSKVPDYSKDIMDNTELDSSGIGDTNTSETAKNDPATGKKNERDKKISTAANDGTDKTDKINVNIDEILKRKVRKGLEAAQQ